MSRSVVSTLTTILLALAAFSYLARDQAEEFRRAFLRETRSGIDEIAGSAREVPHDLGEAKREIAYAWVEASTRVRAEARILRHRFLDSPQPAVAGK